MSSPPTQWSFSPVPTVPCLSLSGDTPGCLRHTRSAGTFLRWQAGGVMATAAAPPLACPERSHTLLSAHLKEPTWRSEELRRWHGHLYHGLCPLTDEKTEVRSFGWVGPGVPAHAAWQGRGTPPGAPGPGAQSRSYGTTRQWTRARGPNRARARSRRQRLPRRLTGDTAPHLLGDACVTGHTWCRQGGAATTGMDGWGVPPGSGHSDHRSQSHSAASPGLCPASHLGTEGRGPGVGSAASLLPLPHGWGQCPEDKADPRATSPAGCGEHCCGSRLGSDGLAPPWPGRGAFAPDPEQSRHGRQAGLAGGSQHPPV